MAYPLIEGQLYVIDIPQDFAPFNKPGVSEVVMKNCKWYNDAPLGTECYATDGTVFCPEWIIGMGSLIQENE